VQTEEQRRKIDQVSELVTKFCDLANGLALKFKVASDPFAVDDGAFQIGRWKGVWSVLWVDSEGELNLRYASVAVKRKFLVVAEKFFKKYLGEAQHWEKTIDLDIEKGREALDQIAKLIA
jgi:hypothetical protein